MNWERPNWPVCGCWNTLGKRKVRRRKACSAYQREEALPLSQPCQNETRSHSVPPRLPLCIAPSSNVWGMLEESGLIVLSPLHNAQRCLCPRMSCDHPCVSVLPRRGQSGRLSLQRRCNYLCHRLRGRSSPGREALVLLLCAELEG